MSPALEDILTSGDLASRGVLFVCEDVARADTLAGALARAWLCDSDPLGCGTCFHCRGDYSGKTPLVRFEPGGAGRGELTRAMAPFGERDVWCVVVHDASRMAEDAAGFLVAALVAGRFERGGLLVLTAQSVESVPEPVRSRCVRFDIRDGEPVPARADEWSAERTRAEEFEALGLCLSGDVFGPHRAAIEELSLEPVGRLVRSWEEKIESGEDDDGAERAVAGVILRADRACERACGFMKLRTVDGCEIEVRPGEALPDGQRALLRVGSCVLLCVSFARGLERWWGTPTVGNVRDVVPVRAGRVCPVPH